MHLLLSWRAPRQLFFSCEEGAHVVCVLVKGAGIVHSNIVNVEDIHMEARCQHHRIEG